MKPDEPIQNQGGVGLPASSPAQPPVQNSSREAAANVIRNKIDSLYGDSPIATTTQPAAQPTEQQGNIQNSNPYLRDHSPTPQPQQDEWQAYHSAWQEYYQKYYEAYYTHHLDQAKKAQQANAPASTTGYFGSGPQPEEQVEPDEPSQEQEPVTQEQALQSLRRRLLARVQTSATKVRKSRHFIPIISAAVVVLLFTFIQYNQFFIGTVAAYISPGSIDPQNIVVDPNTDIAVSDEPRLIIPKINVDVPVVYDIGADHESQMAGMRKGVAHFAIPGASSHPGEVGNTVIAGHSTNDLFDSGDYKFIFAQLEKLEVGDTIYAHYEGTRYSYVVTKTEVVKPTEVNKLIYETSKPMLTLITCTPLGTAINRLLVTAEQVSPDPSGAKAVPELDSSGEDAELPGTSPTLFERLFGIGN